MKRILNILLWVGILTYMLVIQGLVNHEMGSVPCHAISVRVVDSSQNRFVTSHDVYAMVLRAYPDILGQPMDVVHTEALENTVRKYPFIKNAEAYKASDGTLHIRTSQRTPVVRILDPDGGGYYIDSEGYTMPLSPYYSARVLVANGSRLDGIEMGISLDEHRGQKKYETAWEVYRLAKFIHDHELWRSQLEQIYVHRNGEFDMVPRVGAHEIILGGFEGFEEKFKKLHALYQQALNHEGWNQYQSINLKYKDQVVCKKR